MYENIGSKIKALAKVLFALGALAAVFIGFAIMGNSNDYDDPMFFIGFAVVVLGPVVALVFSWLIYGFGELIDKACDIEQNTRGNATTYKEHPKQNDQTQPKINLSAIENHQTTEIIVENSGLPQQKVVLPKKGNLKLLPCPECGEDLDFMGWNDKELKTTQTCPLCGKEILFKA